MIVEAREIDHTDAVGEPRREGVPQLEGEAGLAGATRTGQRQQPAPELEQEPARVVELPSAAYQAACGQRQGIEAPTSLEHLVNAPGIEGAARRRGS